MASIRMFEGAARFGNGANRIPVGNRRELDEIERSGRVRVEKLLLRGRGALGYECLRLSTPNATRTTDRMQARRDIRSNKKADQLGKTDKIAEKATVAGC